MEKLKTIIYRLLHWSEKYTKADMVYIASGNFWLIFGRIFVVGGGILLTVAFANLLPPETFGTYKYVLAVVGFLGAFSLTGMGTAITRAVAQGLDGVVYEGFRENIRWSVLAGALILATSAYYFLNDNNILGVSFLCAAVFTPFISAGGIIKGFLPGKKDFKRNATYGIPRNIISIISIITTLFFTDNILSIIFVYFFTNAILSMGMYWYVLHVYRPQKISKENAQETMRYAKHLSVIGFFTQTVSELDKLLLWHFAGPVKLAVYIFATAPVRELRNLMENIFPLALPKFAEKSFADAKKNIPLRVYQMLLIVVPVAVVYIILAPLLFTYVFPQYVSAVVYSQIFALTLLVQSKGFVYTIINAHAKIKENYILTLSESVIRALLLITLVPPYGIMGAIIGILISEVVNTIIVYALFKKI